MHINTSYKIIFKNKFKQTQNLYLNSSPSKVSGQLARLVNKILEKEVH